MTFSIPIVLILVHYVADFVVQTDWQARNKSTNWNALLRHTFTYSLFFMWLGWEFALITFVTHTATDAVTSRISKWFWEQKKAHGFFVVVGADQVIHYVTLAATYQYLVTP